MSEPRNWLCIITNDREVDNVDELTRDIWTHFDGIAAVVHPQGGDGRVKQLLEERKGRGFVFERPYLFHNGHSMNEVILNPVIGALDCCWLRDTLERFNPVFTTRVREFAAALYGQGIWNLAQHSKILMFRRWYGQQVFNGLHWGVHGLHGQTLPINQVQGYENERDYAYSVRNERRGPLHRYRHEVYYLLDYGLNGNHLALFHPDPADLNRAYQRLYQLMGYLADRGIRGTDQFGAWLKTEWVANGRLPMDVQHWINMERPFRNYFRYFVLGHTHEEILKDEDTWRL